MIHFLGGVLNLFKHDCQSFKGLAVIHTVVTGLSHYHFLLYAARNIPF